MINRRAMLRAASAGLAIASVFLLATCDLDKLTKPNETFTANNPFDSTELTLTINGTTSVAGVLTVPLLGTATMAVTSTSVELGNVVKRYYSALPGFISVDSITGVITGNTLGTAKVTAKILAPELGSGVTISKNVRVRFKGIKVVTPLAVDSLSGLGQTRTVSVQGTNNNNAVVAGALTLDSARMRTGAGVIDTSSIRIVGTTLTAKKNGTAFMVAFFDGLRDSVAVKVRQVAKSITFPTTDFTAKAVNFNMTVPLTVKDVQDSVIPTPTVTWATKDTLKATIGAVTGILKVKSTASDSVFATSDTVTRKQRIIVAQVPASMTKFQGDALSDTVAKNVKIVPTVVVLDSGSTLIAGASVQFKTGLGVNASVNDTIPVLSDAQGKAKPTSWKIGDVAGANNNTLVATSGAATTTFTVSGVAGQPKKLAFNVSPTSASVGGAINPAITVQVLDSLGNPISNATNSVTLSISNNVNAATLSGTLTVAAINGVATFNNISLNASGTGYTLQASSGVLTSVISNAFDIFGTATKLAFTTQPGGTTAGAVMPTVRVAIQDANNNTVGNSNANVTIAISNNAGAGTLTGTLTVAAVNGVATFSTLSINNAGIGYTLAASSTALTGIISSGFTISTVGAASKLAFSVQPSAVVAGAVIAPAMKVQILDANGALTTSTAQVTLSIESTSPTGSTLNGQLTRTAAGGVATFDDISLTKAANGFKLLASSGSLTTATSTSFNVSVGAANKLAFVQQPTHTVTAATMAPPVSVEVQDISGNRVTAGTAVSVTVAMTTGACTGSAISGNGAQNSSSGLATFSTLAFTSTATFCTLSATATGLSAATSLTFNVTSATAPAKLKFTTQPGNQTAGSTVSSTIVTLQDVSGATSNATTGTNVAISLTGGTSTAINGSTSVSVATGTSTATFNNFNVPTAGTYRLVATSTGFDPDTSAQFIISAGIASKVGFISQPANIVAGVPQASITVAVQDANGNTVAGASNVVTLTGNINNGATSMAFSSGIGLTGGLTATASNGIATFNNVAVRKASTIDRMFASASGLNGTTSSAFDVTAAPLSTLGFVVQPTSGVASAANLSPAVQVQAQDSVGNTVTDFVNAITVALTGGTAGAVLSGTKTVAPTLGVSSFSTLNIDKAGTGYQLSASASGVTTATSNTFSVTFGAANKLAWVTQPAATTFFNAPLGASGTATQLAIQDAAGNTVSNDNRSITFTAAGPSTTFKVNGNSTTSGNLSASSGLISFTSTNQINVCCTSGAGYQITAAASGLTSATTSAFTVNAFDVKDKLSWNNEPQSTGYRIALLGPSNNTPNVFVVDKWNNLVTSATDNVTVAILNDANPTTTLAGGAATAATGGGASFPNLLLDKAGNNFTLLATATGLKSDTSLTFNITSPGQVMPCCTGYSYARIGNTVYFTGSNALKSVSIFGGPVTTITGSTNAGQVTTDGTNIYWIERGTNNNGDAFVKKYTVATTTVSTLTVGQVSTEPYGDPEKIYTDGTNVYFTALNGAATQYAIKSISVNAVSGAPTELISINGNPHFFMSGGFIYFRDGSAQVLKRMTTAGASQTTLTTGTIGVERFVLIGTTLYWNDGVNIKSIPNASTAGSAVAATTVLTSPGTVYDVATDGTSLYVNFNGSLRRYATSDFTTFVELSTTIGQYYYTIFFDGTDVFFYNNNFGAIAKVPK